MSILKKYLCFILCFCLFISEVPSCYASTETDAVYASVVIDTVDGKGNTLEKQDGYIEVSNITITDESNTVSVKRANQHDCITVRGNTTSKGAKKPFNIKFNNKVSVLGMDKSKKWCLLANCFDPTLLRNYIAFSIGKDMGLDAPEFRIVELTLDGVYKGCYLLTETVENRAKIDTTKGEFLIEYEAEREDDEKEYFVVDGLRFAVKTPTLEKLENPDFTYNNQTYENYIEDTLNRLIGVLNQGDYQAVTDNFDVDSLAKLYLLNEYYKNTDVSYSSIYYIYRNGKLTAGPLWDFDLSSGNARIAYYFDQNYKSYDTIWANVQLFARLLEYPEFKSLVNKYYHQYRSVFTKYYKNGGVIDDTVKKYKNLIEKNFSTDGAGWSVSELYSSFMRTPDGTYEENLGFLKKWLKRRSEYLLLCSLYYSINNLKDEFIK